MGSEHEEMSSSLRERRTGKQKPIKSTVAHNNPMNINGINASSENPRKIKS